MRLGIVIRKWRINSEITLREAAKQIGIAPATLMRIEQGKDFDGKTMALIVNWLFEEIE